MKPKKTGDKIRVGDRRTRVWVVPSSDNYPLGHDRFIYLKAGVVINVVQEFQYDVRFVGQNPGWKTVQYLVDTIVDKPTPKPTRQSWWRRLCIWMRWVKPTHG